MPRPVVKRQGDGISNARAGIDAVAGWDLTGVLTNAPEALLDGVGGLRSLDGAFGGFLCGSINSRLRRLGAACRRLLITRTEGVGHRAEQYERSDSNEYALTAPTDGSIALALRGVSVGHGLTITQRITCASERGCYSHSIVPGGLEEISSATRLTPSTSLMMRVEMRSRRSYGRRAQSAVMASSLVTARMMIG